MPTIHATITRPAAVDPSGHSHWWQQISRLHTTKHAAVKQRIIAQGMDFDASGCAHTTIGKRDRAGGRLPVSLLFLRLISNTLPVETANSWHLDHYKHYCSTSCIQIVQLQAIS